MRSNRHTWSAVVVVVSLVIAGCGGAGDDDDGGGEASGQVCPLGAIEEAGGDPVTITMWHSMNSANGEALTTLTDRFNASQSEVRVELVNQQTYDDTLIKYRAALGGGSRPDVVQIQEVDQQLMIDSQSVLPVEACIEADELDRDDFLPRAVNYYTVGGTQWGMPFAVSNPVLYYNRQAFEKAGLDPDDPPETLDELRVTAEKIVESGASGIGMALKIDSWYLEEWLAMTGNLFADHGNGRDGRVTELLFGGEQGQEIFRWLSDMSREGLAQATPKDTFDNLLAIGNNVVAMTMDTSAALGTIQQVLASGQFPDVTLGVAPLPGPEAGGGTIIAGSALYISKRSSPAQQEAAWRYVRFLTEAQQAAEWAAATGYVPVRKSAAELPLIRDLWARSPEFKVAYDQILRGEETDATAGPTVGDIQGVRRGIIAAEEAIFHQGTDPADALNDALDNGNRAIADYEARIGG